MHEDYPMLPPTVSIPRQASAYRLHRYTPTTTSNTDRSPGSTFDGCITTPASSTPLKMDRRSHRSSFSPDPDMGGMLSLPRSESQALMPTGEMDPLVRAVQWSARRSASAVELGGHVAQAATDERCHRISGRGTARPLRGSARDEDAPEVSERLDSTLHLSPSPREEQRSCTPPRVVPDVLHVQTSPNLYLQPTSPHHHAPTQAEATCTPNARGGRVAVVVRKRPVCDGETGEDCVRMSSPTLSINLMKQRADMSEYSECCDFSFDGTFDEAARNADIFASCGREMIEVALEGGSASFFGYGQGGSGKTHTMMGSDEDKGLYVLSAAAIFEQLSHSQHVSVAWYEVCSNALFDLLNHRTAVALCESQGRRVEVSGLSWHRIHSANEVWRLIGSAEEQLRRGNTAITAHVVMSLKIERADSDNDCGMLNFVDLAGSERRTGTANDTQTRLDRAEISKSLFALKECFRAQDEKKRHVPFRGSRLTEVLRDAFMGNSKTIVVANISPSSTDCDATINTLRYACRVKGISVETVGPSKARSGQRTMPVSLRSRSAPSLPELATDSAASPTLSTPLAPRSPIMHSSNVVLPQTRGRDGRPPLKTESSPSIVPSTPSKYADDEEATSPAGEAEEVDGRRKRSSFRQRFLHPLADQDNSTATTMMACRPPSADLRGMEERLQAKIMQHLRQDLGSEIQTILDERDGLIAELRKENADLKARLSFCQCGSPLMDEYFSPPPPPPPTRKPSKKQKRGGR